MMVLYQWPQGGAIGAMRQYIIHMFMEKMCKARQVYFYSTIQSLVIQGAL